MLEWIKAHPEDVVFILGLLTALFNWAAKPRTAEEYQALPPRLAAFLRFMAGAFPDPRKVTEAVWQAWNNTHDRRPPR